MCVKFIQNLSDKIYFWLKTLHCDPYFTCHSYKTDTNSQRIMVNTLRGWQTISSNKMYKIIMNIFRFESSLQWKVSLR